MKLKFFSMLLMVLTIFILTSCSSKSNQLNEKEIFGQKTKLNSLGNEQCTKCHTGYKEHFEKSAHFQSLKTLQSNAHAREECLNCHSADYILTTNQTKKPTVQSAHYAVTCLVCHLPHDKNEGIRLRMPKEELCISCHSAGKIQLGKRFSASQKELYYGTGGIDAKPMPSVMAKSGVSCYDCHMPIIEKGKIANGKGKANQSTIDKNISSHEFNVLLTQQVNSCQACHTHMTADTTLKIKNKRQQDVSQKLTEVQTLLTQTESWLATIKNNPSYNTYNKTYEEAVVNYQIVANDKSKGFHNPDYATELLQISKDKLTSLLNQRSE